MCWQSYLLSSLSLTLKIFVSEQIKRSSRTHFFFFLQQALQHNHAVHACHLMLFHNMTIIFVSNYQAAALHSFFRLSGVHYLVSQPNRGHKVLGPGSSWDEMLLWFSFFFSCDVCLGAEVSCIFIFKNIDKRLFICL